MMPALFFKKSALVNRKTLKRLLRLFKERDRALFKKLPKLIYLIEVSPAFSKKLNRKYRKQNKPANVLSFVYGREYAEIILTPIVIRREAKKSGESFNNALVKMIIHGMIHCSGLDHERSKRDERLFEELEQKLMKQLLALSF